MNWQMTNTENGQTSGDLVTVPCGEITLKQLVALKLYGMAKELQRQANVPVEFYISGPTQQDSGQYFEVDIIVPSN